MSNNSIWPIDRTLSGATTLDQNGPGSDGNEEVLCIPQTFSITGASASDGLVSCPGHLFGEEVLPVCRDAVGVFYSPSWLGYDGRRDKGVYTFPTSISLKGNLTVKLEFKLAYFNAAIPHFSHKNSPYSNVILTDTCNMVSFM